MKTYSPKDTKALKRTEAPSYLLETTFICVNLFLLKFYSQPAFEALSIMTVLLPAMVYFVLCLFGNLIKFV